MKPLVQIHFTRTATLFGFFAAGLAIGALQVPVLAWAQSGTGTNRAVVGFISTRAMGSSWVPLPNNCVDATIEVATRPTNQGPEPGVVVLCERR